MNKIMEKENSEITLSTLPVQQEEEQRYEYVFTQQQQPLTSSSSINDEMNGSSDHVFDIVSTVSDHGDVGGQQQQNLFDIVENILKNEFEKIIQAAFLTDRSYSVATMDDVANSVKQLLLQIRNQLRVLSRPKIYDEKRRNLHSQTKLVYMLNTPCENNEQLKYMNDKSQPLIERIEYGSFLKSLQHVFHSLPSMILQLLCTLTTTTTTFADKGKHWDDAVSKIVAMCLAHWEFFLNVDLQNTLSIDDYLFIRYEKEFLFATDYFVIPECKKND